MDITINMCPVVAGIMACDILLVVGGLIALAALIIEEM